MKGPSPSTGAHVRGHREERERREGVQKEHGGKHHEKFSRNSGTLKGADREKHPTKGNRPKMAARHTHTTHTGGSGIVRAPHGPSKGHNEGDTQSVQER